MAELRVEVETRGDRRLLAPGAWVDIANLESLRGRFEQARDDAEVRAIAISFAATDYIDSSAVSLLIQAKSESEQAGKHFALVALSEQVRRVLQETRLLDLFPVYPDPTAFFAGDAGDGAR